MFYCLLLCYCVLVHGAGHQFTQLYGEMCEISYMAVRTASFLTSFLVVCRTNTVHWSIQCCVLRNNGCRPVNIRQGGHDSHDTRYLFCTCTVQTGTIITITLQCRPIDQLQFLVAIMECMHAVQYCSGCEPNLPCCLSEYCTVADAHTSWLLWKFHFPSKI